MLKYPKPKNKRIPFEFVGNDYSVWRVSKKIIGITEAISVCPTCGNQLVRGFTLIPVAADKKAKVDGLCCQHCDCVYTLQAYFVDLIMRDNKFSKGFTLDNEELWNYSFLKERRKEEEKKRKKELERKERQREWYLSKKSLLDTIPSSEVLIGIKHEDGRKSEAIIVKSVNEVNTDANIYHYASEEGREILSAAFAEQREGEGTLAGEKFHVIGSPIFKNRLESSLSNTTLATEINIKSGGGYATEIKNNGFEIVDVLWYSMQTSRYEIVRATRRKSDGFCYVDIGIFRRFVREYGRPSLTPNFVSRSNIFYSGELNEESLLKEYGYMVNKKDNLSPSFRQELLAEIIDLEIMSAKQIVNFLDFLIRTRPHQPDAQWAWKEDLKFVENYKANPQRFLIAR